MLLCLLNTLVETTDYLIDKHLEDQKHLVLISLPASIYKRSKYINTEEWKQTFKEYFNSFSDMHYHFFNADENVTKHVQAACNKLITGELSSVILAGSDSLVNDLTYQELILQNRLCSNTISNGVIPGEAAASVVIQSINVKNIQPLAILKGLSFTNEPNSGKSKLQQIKWP
jgi:hypothetical protein